MRRAAIPLLLAVALSLAVPAGADKALRRSEVKRDAAEISRDYLGAILTRHIRSPKVRVGVCRFHNGGGSCRVRVRGTAHCVGRIQIRPVDDGYGAWASWLRCH